MTGLFKIGATDLTKWEKTASHDVNREDVYDEWIDGNWKTHRVIARTRISGKVTLSFPRESDYTAFMTLLSTERNADGYYTVTAWCSNTNSAETFEAFLDVAGETKWDLTTPRKWAGVTVTITGR